MDVSDRTALLVTIAACVLVLAWTLLATAHGAW